MDQQSDNFTAEMLLKQLGLVQTERGTTTAGAQTVMRLLGADGIPLQGVRFVDGSGLSLLDRMTADRARRDPAGAVRGPDAAACPACRAAGGR